MKFLGFVVIAALAFLAAPIATAQTCSEFVTVENSTNLSEDYSKVMLQWNCPTSERIPGQMHYHIIISNEPDIPALALTGSQAQSLVVPTLTSDGMTVTFSEDWQATNEGVGAELVFRAGQVKHLTMDGFYDHYYIDDMAGSLETIEDSGVGIVLHIKSASTGNLKVVHKGVGDSGAVLLDASQANVEVDINGLQHDMRVKCKSISGTIGGASDRLVVVSGEVTSLKMTGVGVDVDLSTGVTGGCANVLNEGISCSCDENNEINFEIEPLDCKGPTMDTRQCIDDDSGSGAFTTSRTLGLIMAIAVSAFVAVVAGTWI